MQTQCPHCLTVFNVTALALSAKSGWVRCGVCQQAFLALARLQEVIVPPPDAIVRTPLRTQEAIAPAPQPAKSIAPPTTLSPLLPPLSPLSPPPSSPVSSPSPLVQSTQTRVSQEGTHSEKHAEKTSQKGETAKKILSRWINHELFWQTWVGVLALLMMIQGWISQTPSPSSQPTHRLAVVSQSLQPVALPADAGAPLLVRLDATISNPMTESLALPSLDIELRNAQGEALYVEHVPSAQMNPNEPTLAPHHAQTIALWLKPKVSLASVDWTQTHLQWRGAEVEKTPAP